ncbi:MAG: hypothetical protein WAU47_11705 [Desulfobaccales bacterium]
MDQEKSAASCGMVNFPGFIAEICLDLKYPGGTVKPPDFFLFFGQYVLYTEYDIGVWNPGARKQDQTRN